MAVHVRAPLLVLVLLCVAVSAEFTPVAEFHGINSYAFFGSAVDMDGDVAVIGSPNAVDSTDSNAPKTGAAYVLHRGSSGWEEVQVLYGEDGIDWFGIDVAISGDWLAVGATLAELHSQSQNTGSVYMYKKNSAGVFEFKQRVDNPEPDKDDNFGYCVSMDGDRLIVGAPYGDNETSTAAGDTTSNQGSVFIFERTGDVWSLVFTDHGSDYSGNLGFNVAISGDYAFGGAHLGDSSPSRRGNDYAGVALVYHRSAAGEWTMVQRLVAATPESREQFSRGLDADDDLLAAGVPQATDDSNLPYSGELAIFRRNSDGEYKLEATIPGPDSHQYHGMHISIAHGIIATGSYLAPDRSAGIATVYQQVDGTWTTTHTLNGSDVGAGGGSWFSSGVVLEVTNTQTTLIVSGWVHVPDDAQAGAFNIGAAWVFEDTGITVDGNVGPPQSSAQWSAPCGCDGLGAAPIVAHAADSTSVTLSFDSTLPDNAPCVAEPAQ